MKKLLDYSEVSSDIRDLLNVMGDLTATASHNRGLRQLNIDADSERLSGHLDEDEIFVPSHIVDTNIRREQAKYVSYITSARRSAIFSSVNDPTFATGGIERDFTDRSRYTGWQIPLFKTIDCMQLNGYAVTEVRFDMSKPGHFGVEAVNYEDLAFAEDTRDIQSCEMLVHRHYFTGTQLRSMVKENEFNKKEIELLTEIDAEGGKDPSVDSLYEVEKVLFRVKGAVHVAWSCVDKCNDWLRKPRTLFMGRRDGSIMLEERDYPYIIYNYMIQEDSTIQNACGRAFLDKNMQEAVSSLLSSFVTAHRRGANFYFSKDNDDPNNTNLQTGVKFQPGALIDSNIKQFQLRPPDTTMIAAIQTLMSQNAQEQSQVNYAAMNRKDSRKTATEIQAASGEAQMLSSTQVALFSISLKETYTWCWNIYSSRVLAGLLQTHVDIDTFRNHNFILKPAGDVDVIERGEKVQKMMSSWSIISTTGLAIPFLKDLVRLMFPDEGESYVQYIDEGVQKDKLLQQLSQVVSSLTQDPQTGELTEESQPHANQLQLLQQQVAEVLGHGGGSKA